MLKTLIGAESRQMVNFPFAGTARFVKKASSALQKIDRNRLKPERHEGLGLPN